MPPILLAIFSPVGRIGLIAVVAIAVLLWLRADIKHQAKTEVQSKLQSNEITKIKKANDAQDRIRNTHRAKPDRLRRQDDGFRRID